MKTTINYTGRKKILAADVSIVLRQDGAVWTFDADLTLAKYHFPRNAEIWVEAHRQNLWMQFHWGTISALKAAAVRELSEFDVPDGILFRVRVVQPAGAEHHKLLGEADGVPFVRVGDANAKRKPLLEPVPDSLDQLLWKLDLDSDPPRLLINREALPSWKEVAQSPVFTCLVYPEVLRRLLSETLFENEWSDEDDGGWGTDWINFAKSMGGLSAPPSDREGRQAWIDDAVSAFTQRNQIRTTWNKIEEETTR